MGFTDIPFQAGGWEPPVRGTEAERHAARLSLAGMAVRLHPEEPVAALAEVLAALGLDAEAA